jgi:hypothetical protein
MCLLASPPAPGASNPARAAAARTLPPPARQQLALDALAGQSITDLAAQHDVSRKFVYRQLQRAHDGLEQAFAPPPDEPAQLLFWLPVTKPWRHQLVLGLLLICHSSLRGVCELLTDLFDYPLSLGTVHHLLQQAVAPARACHQGQHLAAVRLGAPDEIFQAGQPVLVGADVASTYCYLLSLEEHRDADTWGIRLLELAERGFQPDATIADFASRLRAGQAAALPGVPCRGDVFHALQKLVPVVGYLDNRAYATIATRSDLERRPARTETREGRKALSLAAQLHHARVAETKAITLAEDVTLLLRWLREDLLRVAGPDYETRSALSDWLVAELRAREPQCPHRLRPVRTLLENHQADLLAFAKDLNQQLQALAAEFAVAPAVVQEILQTTALPPTSGPRWVREAALWHQLGERYPAVRGAVTELAGRVVRASSVIENFNSRLRNYFFLRRHLGRDYLALRQFFLNHRRFLRSEHAERAGKSPAELLTGQPHPHWLELLGFQRFTRA